MALALAGIIAGSVAGVATVAARAARAAARLDRAVAAVESAQSRLSGVPYAALPGVFGAARDATTASMSTGGGGAPPGWDALLLGLPGGVLEATLEGLGSDGVSAPFDSALALRVAVRARWTEDGRTRETEVLDVRF